MLTWESSQLEHAEAEKTRAWADKDQCLEEANTIARDQAAAAAQTLLDTQAAMAEVGVRWGCFL